MASTIIDVTNINEKVYNYIKQNIIDFTFPAGHKLDIKNLSKTLGTSQTPIKDALARLSGEGLVEITSRIGSFVTNITEADIHEILQSRIILESAVIEEIAEKISDKQLEIIEKLYKKSMSFAVNQDDFESYKKFMKYDSQFHLSFFQIFGNSRLLNFYNNLNAHMQVVRFRLLNRNMGKLPNTDEEHKNILDALFQHNAENAKKAVIIHIQKLDRLCSYFATQDKDTVI